MLHYVLVAIEEVRGRGRMREEGRSIGSERTKEREERGHLIELVFALGKIKHFSLVK